MYTHELTVATAAVRLASLLTKGVQQAVIASSSSTVIKDDKSPVTIGDFAAQAVIINAIQASFPGDAVVGEETADGLDDSFLGQILAAINTARESFAKEYKSEVPLANSQFPLNTIEDVRNTLNLGDYKGGRTGRFWCLDPIDGTKGFLRGEQFAVCLGLVVDGVVQVGCIGCPNLKLAPYGGADIPGHEPMGYIFRAVKGQGAFYNTATLSGAWTPLKVRRLESTAEMATLEGVEKGHSAHGEQDEIKQRLGIARALHLDSQAKYCLLALGLADVYLRLPISLKYQEKIWDHAAGNVIVLEAGGEHTDAIQGVPLDFGEGRTLATKGVIASAGPAKLHDLVVATSRDVIAERK
ncbi:3'(2'),5'-bisphosphate nucleotidase [Maudiozyma humilis]|uniref:3'(2'),5'-bisphosphate nucleotidase n=1 Tax=Maudiozyma humilis TaxID=51915 RepID=A0AAV5S2Z6_MAUHU|nr:3'(2'),5'-bisphosphate nucleotidase [Kazachstania humilis]